MPADRFPVLAGVLRAQARSLLWWGVALALVCSLYIGLYPSMGAGGEIQALIEQMPDAMVNAFGYDQIASAGGWITSTVYRLIAPVLLLVFGIGAGARLVAGEEEDGSLELELASPVARGRLYLERLLALWLDLAVLVAVVAAVTLALVLGLELDVPVLNVLAGSVGLLLLVLGFATVAFAVGAATGRRSLALAVAAGSAVLAYVFDALGPTVGAAWMTAVSPFSWYIEESPIIHGFQPAKLAVLALVPVVAAAAASLRFVRRDLMV